MNDERPPPHRDRPPFDILKAVFYLVAFVIGAHVFYAGLSLMACLYVDIQLGKVECTGERIMEVLAAALAAALAFAGGKMQGPKQ